MDPLSITASVMSVTAGCMKIVKTTSDLREKYKHAQTTLSALCAEAWCCDVPKAVAKQLSERPELVATFDVAVTGCVAVYAVLDEEIQSLVAHGLDAGNDLGWTDKAKFLWKEGFMKDLLQQIRGLQSALTLLMQAMQLESISDLHQLIESHGVMLGRIADQTRSLRSKHPSVAAPASILERALHDDAQSMVGTWNTAATDSSFTFDDLIVNSKVYRRIFAQASMSGSSAAVTSTPPADEAAPVNSTPPALGTPHSMPSTPPLQGREVTMEVDLPTQIPWTTSELSAQVANRPSSTSVLPSRLLSYVDGELVVIDPRSHGVSHYDILSYQWGQGVPRHNPGIKGVDWDVTLAPQRLQDIKRLMVAGDVQHIWVDALCINLADQSAMTVETANMYEYFKQAATTHIMLDMREVWNSQDMIDNLAFIDQILNSMRGSALAAESGLSATLANRLETWTNCTWLFPLDKLAVRSVSIELGVLNCYSSCIINVRSLFDNQYFGRVWMLQETLLGKNITMWGINAESISCIGEFQTWIDLTSEAKDKAPKLQAWIEHSKFQKTDAVARILAVIEEDILMLDGLQTQVLSISAARTDIINGGPQWWRENHTGISNVFAAVALKPRECMQRGDLFRGLLGVFDGLFTSEEIMKYMIGDDIDAISFAFFKQLSIKTGYAWTRLALSSRDRGQWDWIPVTVDSSRLMTTDIFAGVFNLGVLKSEGLAMATAMTGIVGTPRPYMRMQLRQHSGRVSRFSFKGCNCGKTVKKSTFSSKPIPTLDLCRNVGGDETGKILVQFATILGSVLDPACDMVAFRRRLLRKLQPSWKVSDFNANPPGWIDRCVSRTSWETVSFPWLRTHNMSMNYDLVDLIGCESRLETEHSATVSCELHIRCGCVIVAPLAFVLGAITAVDGSCLGEILAFRDSDDRVTLRDGGSLVQVSSAGSVFQLVAFGGDVDAHESFASMCRNTEDGKPVYSKHRWPTGRALVREDFKHGKTDFASDYGYVETGGPGNLLICKKRVSEHYKVIGVCIDEYIANKNGYQEVIIR